MSELLISIQTDSGTPVFESLSSQELQQRIDVFTSDSQSIIDVADVGSSFAFSNDIMIVKEKNNIELPTFPSFTAYDYFQKGTYATIQTKLRYNYNMTTSSVDTTFTNILSNITQELRPPKTSTTFTYDFKFSQNRNGTLSGSNGGGY